MERARAGQGTERWKVLFTEGQGRARARGKQRGVDGLSQQGKARVRARAGQSCKGKGRTVLLTAGQGRCKRKGKGKSRALDGLLSVCIFVYCPGDKLRANRQSSHCTTSSTQDIAALRKATISSLITDYLACIT